MKKPKQSVWQVLLLQNNYTIKFELEIELFRNSKWFNWEEESLNSEYEEKFDLLF